MQRLPRYRLPLWFLRRIREYIQSTMPLQSTNNLRQLLVYTNPVVALALFKNILPVMAAKALWNKQLIPTVLGPPASLSLLALLPERSSPLRSRYVCLSCSISEEVPIAGHLNKPSATFNYGSRPSLDCFSPHCHITFPPFSSCLSVTISSHFSCVLRTSTRPLLD